MNREQQVNQHNQLEYSTVNNSRAYIRLDNKLHPLQKNIKNNEIKINQIQCSSLESKAVIKEAILSSIKCANLKN